MSEDEDDELHPTGKAAFMPALWGGMVHRPVVSGVVFAMLATVSVLVFAGVVSSGGAHAPQKAAQARISAEIAVPAGDIKPEKPAEAKAEANTDTHQKPLEEKPVEEVKATPPHTTDTAAHSDAAAQPPKGESLTVEDDAAAAPATTTEGAEAPHTQPAVAETDAANTSAHPTTAAQPVQAAAEAAPATSEPVSEPKATRPLPVIAEMALLVTDIGLNRRLAEAVDKNLPRETSLAVSVYGADPAGTAAAFAETGRDVWMMLSTQSTRAGIDPGPMALSAGASAELNSELIKKQMDAAGASITGIYVPDDADITLNGDVWKDVAMGVIADSKMVLDGTRTQVATELYVQRSESKISAYLKSDITIDGSVPPAALKNNLDAIVQTVLKDREAIVVVKNPTAATAQTLGEWVNTLATRGIRLVPASKFTGLKG